MSTRARILIGALGLGARGAFADLIFAALGVVGTIFTGAFLADFSTLARLLVVAFEFHTAIFRTLLAFTTVSISGALWLRLVATASQYSGSN